MFRFSVDEETARRASDKQLASNNITLDEDWEQGLQDTGDAMPGERCYRAETKTPRTVDDAISFVRGHFIAAPHRIWLGDEQYEIGDREKSGEETDGS